MTPEERESIIDNLMKVFGNKLSRATIAKQVDEQAAVINKLSPEAQDLYVGQLIDTIKTK